MSETKVTPGYFENSPEDKEIFEELGIKEYSTDELREQLRAATEELHTESEVKGTYGNLDRIQSLNERVRNLHNEIQEREKVEGPEQPIIEHGEIS